MRNRVGHRRHRATFDSHNGNADTYGQPTYDNDADYTTFVANWPCEFVSTVGGEMLRGRMVTAKSTHALFGNFAAVEGIDVKMRVTINGELYGITSANDPTGDRMEMRVELRKEM